MGWEPKNVLSRITSAFAAAVALVVRNGSRSFRLGSSVAALAAVGVGIAAHNQKQAAKSRERKRLIKKLNKHEGIIKALSEEAKKARIATTSTSLNILLQQAIKDLGKDLGLLNGENMSKPNLSSERRLQ
jgi:hypothetical protein